MASPTETLEALERTHRAFYDAFVGLDIHAMDRVWAHDDTVKCVHPGRPIVTGWPSVRRAWELIFGATARIHIELGPADVQMVGSMAWITVIEKIETTSSGGERTRGSCIATNVLELRGIAWRLVHHHSSAFPVPGR